MTIPLTANAVRDAAPKDIINVNHGGDLRRPTEYNAFKNLDDWSPTSITEEKPKLPVIPFKNPNFRG